MDVDLILKLGACVFSSILTYICVINLCNYFHVDEKEVVKRLIAVKNHDFKGNKPNNNNFAMAKSNFQFKVFSKIFKNIKIVEKTVDIIGKSVILYIETVVSMKINC